MLAPCHAPLPRTGILPHIASLYLRNPEEEKTKSVNQEVEKTQPAAEGILQRPQHALRAAENDNKRAVGYSDP